ncbi:4-hydroxy-3-methylbut-2-en-1-yl diphosphate synthase IspG [Clostridium aceticum]|uniref:4-hydroxy-3-methylbut-2-en-1-yl diphosphate synthase (flavodoxin) n=1 Tax=Clostridium aceticum TaxID=84022 RepID=A0A0D8I799_9CLOT|nr:flavodoxin-dependent (E)-4-hydroxy-3-methylbut-2-enyl-diphosphate synthase [Clostridium aceticum]AKL95440.1 4-hydroxy-3-methylbut-2-en-1-yl diphosphate synthase IspG [Clostridium aceticum]KJF25929.1 4-hydroxy-3-methylbut-2-en-1-yl diphosphate synthase [Clostridium aceticum]
MRRSTKEITCGNIFIGANHPISLQSMTTTDTRDITSTVKQIHRLEEAGCDIVRVAVPNMQAAEALKDIKVQTSIPIVADIHFDYRLALESLKQGIDGLRLNPGNIGDKSRVKEVVKLAKERNVKIRIGVNAGSLEKNLLQKYGHPTAEAMVESALAHIAILEEMNFYNIVISLKASDVHLTVDAYKKMAEAVDYPLHLGITEAGTIWGGTVKSSIGIGALLLMGIGDTIRVSLTGDPVEEIKVGKEILKSLGLIKNEITMISCPTCGRCQINLIDLANEIEKKISHLKKPLKVAIMGCAVNGPGEARDADIGIAGGSESGLLFKKGKIIKKVPEKEIIQTLMEEIENM